MPIFLINFKNILLIMSSLTEQQINNLDIDKIDEILSSKKFIPSNKKALLVKRKELLNKKNFNLDKSKDLFPNLDSKQSDTSLKKQSAWTKGSKKIYDGSNAPALKKQDLLKREKKVEKKEMEQLEDFINSEEEYYSEEYDYDSD